MRITASTGSSAVRPARFASRAGIRRASPLPTRRTWPEIRSSVTLREFALRPLKGSRPGGGCPWPRVQTRRGRGPRPPVNPRAILGSARSPRTVTQAPTTHDLPCPVTGDRGDRSRSSRSLLAARAGADQGPLFGRHRVLVGPRCGFVRRTSPWEQESWEPYCTGFSPANVQIGGDLPLPQMSKLRDFASMGVPWGRRGPRRRRR